MASALDRSLLLDPWPGDEGWQQDDAAGLSESLGAFVRASWHVLEASPLVDEWYIDALADHGQAWVRGEIPSLMIHIRPRMLKTTILSVMLGAWAWTSCDTTRLLWGSYSRERRDEDSRLTRKLVASPWYQARWSRPLAADQSIKHRFALASGGQRYSAIYGTATTGDGGQLLGLDDPQNAGDQYSPTELDHDHTWFYDTWERRRDDGAASPMLIVTQRLGPSDLCARLRYDDPDRWAVLALQTRKTTITVAEYHRGEDVKRLPLVDTPLSRDGRFVDPREVGELLSSRVSEAELTAMETGRPLVYYAQEQQAPVQGMAEGARVYAFDRLKHFKSFAARMGQPSLPAAVAEALRTGWRVTTGWDHGVDARREIGHVLLWHPVLKEMWVVGTYANTGRTTPTDDARGMRAVLDGLGIPIRAVVESQGDVGSLGKAAAGDIAPSINAALSMARDERGAPILGFPIGTAAKGPGSVERGTEVLNTAFASGALFLDIGCAMLAGALEGWTGGEQLKDFVDALRYGARYRLESWQVAGGVQ